MSDCFICNTMTKVHAFLAKFLRRQREEFFDIRLARGQQGRQDPAPGRSDLITVPAAYLADQPVRPQPRPGPRDTAAAPTLFVRVGFGRVEGRAHVAVAKARHRPFAPVDDFQQRPVFLRPRVEAAMTTPVLLPPAGTPAGPPPRRWCRRSGRVELQKATGRRWLWCGF